MDGSGWPLLLYRSNTLTTLSSAEWFIMRVLALVTRLLRLHPDAFLVNACSSAREKTACTCVGPLDSWMFVQARGGGEPKQKSQITLDLDVEVLNSIRCCPRPLQRIQVPAQSCPIAAADGQGRVHDESAL